MKPYTIAVPRYAVESEAGTHLEIFSQKNNAIKAAIKLANEYRGNTFLVIKKTFHKRKQVFRICLDMEMNFEDVSVAYQALVDAFQDKLSKTKYWRKSDGSRK